MWDRYSGRLICSTHGYVQIYSDNIQFTDPQIQESIQNKFKKKPIYTLWETEIFIDELFIYTEKKWRLRKWHYVYHNNA